MHGGACSNQGAGFKCRCRSGFKGIKCEQQSKFKTAWNQRVRFLGIYLCEIVIIRSNVNCNCV